MFKLELRIILFMCVYVRVYVCADYFYVLLYVVVY